MLSEHLLAFPCWHDVSMVIKLPAEPVGGGGTTSPGSDSQLVQRHPQEEESSLMLKQYLIESVFLPENCYDTTCNQKMINRVVLQSYFITLTIQ